MEEIWKDIPEFEGLYQISNLGNVRSLYSGSYHIISQFSIPSGYMYVSLHKAGKKINRSVHRLVAKAFIDNPCNLKDVNHIDGNKQNNVVSNLEWCSHKDNMKHAVYTGLHTKFNQKKVLCVETGVIYNSAVAAHKATGADVRNISKVCRGKPNSHTTGGYHWRFV